MTEPMRELRLLVSDVDNTLLGDDEATERFARWHASRRGGVRLAYASGRLFDSIAETVRQTSLPDPDVVIGGVGTDIQEYPSGRALQAWHEANSAHWNPDAIRAILAGDARLEPQPSSEQTPFKISYYMHDASERELAAIQRRLEQAGYDAQIVYSSNRDLDVLPKGANKGTAAAFLAYTWDISPDQVIVAGDSGNDRALFDHGFRGIIVANARPELAGVQHPLIYHARKPYADGVLEGIAYWTGDHSIG